MTRVLVTGAAGNIGRKLIAALSADPGLAIVAADRSAAPGILALDVASWSDRWAELFATVDIVIHLAGESRPTARWDEVHPANVLGTANVLRASREAGVRRVVFASTNQIMGGYRFLERRMDADAPPLPLNPYAVSKLIGEEMGRAFAAETGRDFLALRIGNIMRGDNVPGPHMRLGRWGQEMWLSDRDMVAGMRRAIAAGPLGFAMLYLVSDNPGMRWDIAPGRELIGYVPRDGQAAVITEEVAAMDEAARKAVLVPGGWLDQYGNRLEAFRP
jgi:uronate dehydrogenase